MTLRETFKLKGTNTVAIGASSLAVFSDITNAEKNNNLPHTTFTLGNQSTTCTLYIFLDDASDLNAPDYILFPQQQITVEHREGLTFRTLFIYNTNTTTEVAINEFKYRISTVKEVQ